MTQTGSVLSLSPTFTSYSSSRLTEIAARVVEEFREQDDEVDESFSSFCASVDGDLEEKGFFEGLENEKEEKIEKVEDDGDNGQQQKEEDEEEEKDVDEEFEFAFVTRDSVSSPAPADEIFYNGQIRPIYPLFDTSLMFDGAESAKENEDSSYDKSMQKPPTVPETTRMSLRKFFVEERELSSSCSSSEADEFESLAPGTFCVWNPKRVEVEAKGHCKKSNSTGSSKRWRFRDLLHRSSSDGKDRFVFLSHSNSHNGGNNGKKREEVEKFDKTSVATSKVADKNVAAQQYEKNGGERRRVSYLPYRQDLVGIFSNVNGASRNLSRF